MAIESVLVVDDDARVLQALARNRRYRVVGTTDPGEASRLAQECDLALVDLRLGPASGVDVVRDLKRERPELFVVLWSGYVSVDVTAAAVRAGADDVVQKPITLDRVVQRALGAEPTADDIPTLAEVERDYILRVLDDCRGNLSLTARKLGIYRSSLKRRLRKIG